MQEKHILLISLLILTLGLIFLFFYSEELDLEKKTHLEENYIEDEVKIVGEISKVSKQDKVIFIEVSGQKVIKTDAIVFADKNIFLEEGDFVEITGTIEEYNGKKEIIANSVLKK